MTSQEYIISTLQALAEPVQGQDTDNIPLEEVIFAKLLSKKFRKYSVTPAYQLHIKNAIKENVQNNKPINITFLGGCYKLWRLQEAPESDWAELFACIYYSRWLKSICALYPPGVWFDFFLDDVIVSRINNIDEDDVSSYRNSRQQVLDFLKPYQPSNMSMTLTGVGELFDSRQAYEESLSRNIKKLSEELPGGLPQLSDIEAASTTLNVKTTPEQESDPHWREKVELVHSAYMLSKAETGYSTTIDKIRAFTQPLDSGKSLSIGATKDSVTKFWVGVGALKSRGDSFRQVILSPKQLTTTTFHWEDVNLKDLDGKNFSKIRVVD
jgi:hypothetical protein